MTPGEDNGSDGINKFHVLGADSVSDTGLILSSSRNKPIRWVSLIPFIHDEHEAQKGQEATLSSISYQGTEAGSKGGQVKPRCFQPPACKITQRESRLC